MTPTYRVATAVPLALALATACGCVPEPVPPPPDVEPGCLAETFELADADARLMGTEDDHLSWGGNGISIGHLDSDEYPDLALGAPGPANAGHGTLYLAHGPLSGDVDLTTAHQGAIGGAALGAQLGAVSLDGNFNGDNFDDLLIGSPGATGEVAKSGAAYLFHGPISGELEASAADVVFRGEIADQYAGISVAAGSDIDHDGTDDILIGAWGWSETASYAGAAFLFHGSDLLDSEYLLSEADARFLGEAAMDGAGYRVAFPGDVDGDQRDDILIAAAGHDAPEANAGAVYLIHGPVAAGVHSLADADVKLLGEQGGDLAGSEISPAGDLNGDGYADLFVGARWTSDGGASSGTVYLLYGPLQGEVELSDAPVRFVGRDDDSVALGATGDIDGDGTLDVLIGASQTSTTGPGAVYLYRGPGAFLDPTGPLTLSADDADVEFVGEGSVDAAGWAVRTADMDLDGLDDILIGAWGNDAGGDLAGAVYLIHGCEF